ncbi:MAG: hypothetical protein M0Q53_21040 [Prolixibacteraceae bacterium]|jgi:uncharacterized membrane protein SpoIIM required for sporulation|nr:hypothetical protein [Prolixibacteraceae bacterium]
MSFNEFHHDYKHHDNSPHYKHDKHDNYNSEQNGQLGWLGAQNYQWLSLINKIQNNPKLRFLCFAVVVVFILLIIGLIVLFFPLIAKLTNYISEYGINGAIKVITDLLETVLNGRK